MEETTVDWDLCLSFFWFSSRGRTGFVCLTFLVAIWSVLAAGNYIYSQPVSTGQRRELSLDLHSDVHMNWLREEEEGGYGTSDSG